ncbi:hypothetical protein D3C85_858420 [compost metagenome]
MSTEPSGFNCKNSFGVTVVIITSDAVTTTPSMVSFGKTFRTFVVVWFTPANGPALSSLAIISRYSLQFTPKSMSK